MILTVSNATEAESITTDAAAAAALIKSEPSGGRRRRLGVFDSAEFQLFAESKISQDNLLYMQAGRFCSHLIDFDLLPPGFTWIV